jgi:hypothetical protein
MLEFLESDENRFLFGILLTFPMGYLMSFIPFGASKHMFAAAAGLYLLFITMGDQWFHVPLVTVISYALLQIRINQYIVPIFAMTYCSYAHIQRQFFDPFDFSCPLMMLTIKLYTISWNLWDGYCIHNKYNLTRAAKSCEQVALFELPSFIEYCGYCFNFSTVLVGPAYEFVHYKMICDGTYKRTNSNISRVIVPLTISIFFAAYHATLFGTYNFNNRDLSPIGHMIAFSAFKAKFYFVWKYVESAHNLWYFGQGAMTSNIDIIGVEFARNLSAFTRQWNEKTSHWLNKYVYQRCGGSAVATYAVAAIWHGFYPGYYLMYATVALATMCERLGRKKLTPRFSKYNLYTVACIIVNHMCGAYAIMPFVVSDFYTSLAIWNDRYYFLHVGMLLFYVVFSFI